MRQYRNQQEEALPSRVPGDIIKDRVEPKPDLGPLWEMLNKRYRQTSGTPHQNALREEFYCRTEEIALEKATLKEAYDYMLAEFVKYDGHERNIIRTEVEVKEIKIKDAKVAIVKTLLHSYKGGHNVSMITAALNRQVAMRKVRFHHFVGLENFRQRLHAAGLLVKEMKDVPKQVGSARHPKTVMTKEPVFNITKDGLHMLTQLDSAIIPKEVMDMVESLLVDLGFSIS